MCVCVSGGVEETRDSKEQNGKGIEQNKGKEKQFHRGRWKRKEKRKGRLTERSGEMRDGLWVLERQATTKIKSMNNF